MNNSPIKTVYCDKSSGFSYTLYGSFIQFHKDGQSFCSIPSRWFKNGKEFEEAANDILTVFSSIYRAAKHRDESELVIYHTNTDEGEYCIGDF